MTRLTSVFATTLLLTAPALASGPGEHGPSSGDVSYLANGAFTYEVFEASVEHVDLAACPVQFDPDAVFCRMTLAADMAHVFVFSYDGTQPLLAVKSYALDDGFLPF